MAAPRRRSCASTWWLAVLVSSSLACSGPRSAPGAASPPAPVAPEPAPPVVPEPAPPAPATPDTAPAALVDCTPSKILCRRRAPDCPQGQVPSVQGSCYGACVAIERCGCAAAEQCPQPEQFTCWSKQHCGPYVR